MHKARAFFYVFPALLSRLAGSVLFALALLLLAGPASAQAFYDDFNGGSVDPVKWRVDLATGGVRWCATSSYYSNSVPGLWQDVVAEACNGVQGTVPYGLLTVGGGFAGFSAPVGSAFPYIWAGPPSRPSPFPVAGDFVLDVRLRFDSIGIHGAGLVVTKWDNTEPVGDNPPIPPGELVFSVWGSPPTLTLLDQTASAAPPYVFHTYTLTYLAGAYTAYIDGVAVLGPTVSGLRPNTLWIGNPVFTHWGDREWADFTLDFVRVEGAGATANLGRSWAQLKTMYR